MFYKFVTSSESIREEHFSHMFVLPLLKANIFYKYLQFFIKWTPLIYKEEQTLIEEEQTLIEEE